VDLAANPVTCGGLCDLQITNLCTLYIPTHPLWLIGVWSQQIAAYRIKVAAARTTAHPPKPPRSLGQLTTTCPLTRTAWDLETPSGVLGARRRVFLLETTRRPGRPGPFRVRKESPLLSLPPKAGVLWIVPPTSIPADVHVLAQGLPAMCLRRRPSGSRLTACVSSFVASQPSGWAFFSPPPPTEWNLGLSFLLAVHHSAAVAIHS